MRRLINQLKEPIYKDDLKRVLLYCSLSSILFGVLAGALQYFAFWITGVGFTIFIYMIAYMVGKELRDRVFTYHILYSILGVVFFFVGCYFYSVSLEMFLYRNIISAFSFTSFITNVFSFLNFKTYLSGNIFNCILDLIIMIFCVMTVWKMSRYRK